MCKICRTAVAAGGCAIPVTERNAIVPASKGESDRDQGYGTIGEHINSMSKQDLLQLVAYQSLRYQKLGDDRMFDHSHPVDEYQPQGNAAVITNTLTLQPDYDMPEKIEAITCIVPVGTTLANIQLGQRQLVPYSGSALTAPLIVLLDGIGLIINSDDPRILTLTGTVTSPPYLGLTGYALTRGQFT